MTFNTSIKTRGSSSSSVTPTSSVSPKRSPKAQLLSSSSVGMTSMGNMTHPLSPPLAANILASNQNTENLQRTTGDGREGVVTEGKEVEKKENILGVAEEEVKGIHEAFMTQQLLEQSAMTGLSECLQVLYTVDPLPYIHVLYHSLIDEAAFFHWSGLSSTNDL